MEFEECTSHLDFACEILRAGKRTRPNSSPMQIFLPILIHLNINQAAGYMNPAKVFAIINLVANFARE